MNEHMEIIMWVIGTGVTVLIFVLTLYLGSEHRHNKEHQQIYDRINAQHLDLRDRLDNIWKHMRNGYNQDNN